MISQVMDVCVGLSQSPFAHLKLWNSCSSLPLLQGSKVTLAATMVVSLSDSNMGLRLWSSLLLFSLSMKYLIMCQELNTDAFYLSHFLRKMVGPDPSQAHAFSSSSFCSWRGVLCDSSRQHVIQFSAAWSDLSGPIPDNTIGKLKFLRSLDLSGNNITSLPSDFWSLSSLKTLNLSFNRISGSLSSNMGNFASLEMLDLSFNSFSGRIPAAIASLVGLTALKLNNNGFQFDVPPGIVSCQSLVVIDLSSNRLTGRLAVGFASAFPALKSLNLSRNLFRGSLMGVVHEDMEMIDVSENEFEGHISQVLSNHKHNWSNLIHLDLSDNRFVGHISDGLSSAKKLQHLDIACNRFRSQKFPRILMLSALQHLNLSRTNLTGSIPSEIRWLSHLRVLDLSSNHLAGHVPLLNLEYVKIFDLSRNELDGDIPRPVLEKITMMQSFNFSYNNLTFCLPGLSQETFQSSFFGLTSNCPVAADPLIMNRRGIRKKTALKLALALTISVAFLLVATLLLLFGLRRKRKFTTCATKQAGSNEEQNLSFQSESDSWTADVNRGARTSVVIFDKPLLNITLADLSTATLNFDRSTLLSEGKFGPSYLAVLPNGFNVAVKVLLGGSTLSDHEAVSVFKRLGEIKHPNIVPLYGYCIAKEQRIAIYEHMEKDNLHNILHDQPQQGLDKEHWSVETCNEAMQSIEAEGGLRTWRLRHKIALGIARALAFIHHGCIPPMTHGDVKTRRVWLDSNQEPRLAEIGVRELWGNVEGERAEEKDVYMYGVVLLEVMSGKKGEEEMVRWVRELVREGKGCRAIDPKMTSNGALEEMTEAVKIGYLCTAEFPSKRPTMHQVVGLLKDLSPNS